MLAFSNLRQKKVQGLGNHFHIHIYGERQFKQNYSSIFKLNEDNNKQIVEMDNNFLRDSFSTNFRSSLDMQLAEASKEIIPVEGNAHVTLEDSTFTPTLNESSVHSFQGEEIRQQKELIQENNEQVENVVEKDKSGITNPGIATSLVSQ